MPDDGRTCGQPDIERLHGAFRGLKADKVPFWEVVYAIPSGLVESIIGISVSQTEFETLPELQLQLAQRLGIDTIGFWGGWSLKREPQREGDDGQGQRALGRLASRVTSAELPPVDIESLRRHLDDFMDVAHRVGAGVFVSTAGVIHNAYMALGYDRLSLLLYDDLPFVEYLMDVSMERNRQVIEMLCEYPVAFIRLVDHVSHGGGLFMRPELLERLWLPRTREMIAPAKEAGVPLEWHCCGQLEWALPRVIELGFDALDPIAPRCNDIYALHEQYGDLITFIGNIGADLLTTGTPEEVREDVFEHIRRLGFIGRYVVKAASSLTEDMPASNILAMSEAVREFGGHD